MNLTIRANLIAFCILLAIMPMQAQDNLLNSINPTSEKLQDLDLDTAVYRTLTYSLSLRMANNDAQSRHYLVEQARLYPNPSFSYEVENFAGNNNWKSWSNREERYIWSQLFETAGKRTLRTQAASSQYYAALVGYDITKLLLLNRLHRAFIQVMAAQESLNVALDQADIAREMLSIATKKVQAGKLSLIQQNKAEVAHSTALIEVGRATVELKNAKRRLSLIWAEPCPDFAKADFPFFDTARPVTFEQCLAELCNQAEVVQSLYYYLNAKHNWRLEKANRIPDVTLQVGYKANYEENNQGLIAGISVPIPIFNRNQGNIGKAYFEMLKTGDQGRQLWLLLESKLAITYEELIRAFEDAELIKNSSLPSALSAFKLAQMGFIEGKFEYLDVLDAQRTLFEVKERYIRALVNYHTKRADIDYLNSQMD
ncbi:cation efflux system membrane protein C [Candidatus Protochlamydia naegleriophila]|uniref:Cation efflux system membrane protein C n=1 Tax=Candidatus Protochlamydia naegleriophila TaxID=389348 RepID=A0A0U5J8G0_9BACT|nr:TolC family protein [Candidatus Protochlamydia naegleriophila]CUI16056.1 cation efflux system membrane protein C [Candidatus Protochlamydia naegleriophila]